MSRVKLNSLGDTIVEVLICMAIVSGALSYSYSVARRGLINVRQAEERSQSVQLAQQQIERLKEYLKNNPNTTTAPPPVTAPKVSILPPSGTPNGFCILKSGSSLIFKRTNDPRDKLCAIRDDGVFWCELPANVAMCNGAIPANRNPDGEGYPFRAAIVYLPGIAGGRPDEFYAVAGIFVVGGGYRANALDFDVVGLPYRIHQ